MTRSRRTKMLVRRISIVLNVPYTQALRLLDEKRELYDTTEFDKLTDEELKEEFLTDETIKEEFLE